MGGGVELQQWLHRVQVFGITGATPIKDTPYVLVQDGVSKELSQKLHPVSKELSQKLRPKTIIPNLFPKIYLFP